MKSYDERSFPQWADNLGADFDLYYCGVNLCLPERVELRRTIAKVDLTRQSIAKAATQITRGRLELLELVCSGPPRNSAELALEVGKSRSETGKKLRWMRENRIISQLGGIWSSTEWGPLVLSLARSRSRLPWAAASDSARARGEK